MPFCSYDLPEIPNYCGQTTRSGGIIRFILIDCADEGLAPVFGTSDAATWETFSANNCTYISNSLLGSKSETSNDKLRTSVCGPEKTVGRTRQYNFRDYNAYVDGFDYDFYEYLQRYRDKYRIAFITCDNHVSEFMRFEIDSDIVIPEDKKNASFHNVVITTIGYNNVKFYKVDGIIPILENNNCI